MKQAHNITEMLREWSDGNRAALEDLMPLVYDELHKEAARFLRRERACCARNAHWNKNSSTSN